MSVYQDVIIAGFGGQGVLLIGNLLAYAAMNRGLQVTYMPVYGVEMRGGTANCTVVISDEEIGSPIIFHPRSLIAMNQPSLDKFQPRVRDDGVQIVNGSIVPAESLETSRLHSYLVPVNDLADELGNMKMANMVALGAWVRATGVIALDEVKRCLPQVFGEHSAKLIPANERALDAGAEFVAAQAAAPGERPLSHASL
jgi:2-oxoglutarate ferredoxin oxidoreductase subunit gamma